MKRMRGENEGTKLESWEITNSSITPDTISSQVFECKTCNRTFSSFQAREGEKSLGLGIKSEPKIEECSISGPGPGRTHEKAQSCNSSINEVVAKVSILKRSCNHKVFCLDLNLTPLQNDLNLLLFRKVSPKVNLSSF